jgi:hypothetical protein
VRSEFGKGIGTRRDTTQGTQQIIKMELGEVAKDEGKQREKGSEDVDE